MSNEVRIGKTQRMHEVHQREKNLRENADVVIRAGEPSPKRPSVQDPKTKRWSYYVESETAAALWRVFEEGEDPWW